MNILPRYTFRSTKEFCPHGDPDCLCDVHVTSPTPIRFDIPHMFHELALQELDDYGVNNRNVVEFFSIVLGCHEIYRREVREESEHNPVWTNVPLEGRAGIGPKVWQDLSDEQRMTLRRHAYAGSPWSYAELELQDYDLSGDDYKVLRKYYNDTRRNNFHGEKRRVEREVRDCEMCAAPFKPYRSDAKFCSKKCVMASYREREGGKREVR